MIDILNLVFLEDFDFEYFFEFLKSHKLAKYVNLLEKILKQTKEAEEINLNRHSFGKKKRKILEKVRSFQVIRE